MITDVLSFPQNEGVLSNLNVNIMKFKFHWGWGIATFMLIFFITIAWRIYFAYQQKINLVTPDYYPKGITYEQEIIKKNNAAALPEDIKVIQTGDSLEVVFPHTGLSGDISGTIHVYHPADYEDDSIFDISLKDSSLTQKIATDFMKAGYYEIQVDWMQDSVLYYHEKPIMIKK